jgi:dUTP pyrophosphatase
MDFEQKNKYTLYIKLSSNNHSDELFNYYKNLELTSHLREDSGVDLYVPHDISFPDNIKENNIIEINHSIKCCMKENSTNLTCGYYLYPRSSIYKYPFTMANSVGIIDSGYRGDIKAMIRIYDINYCIKKNSKLFQLCAPDLSPLKVKVVSSEDSLPESTRSTNGFGSTGR